MSRTRELSPEIVRPPPSIGLKIVRGCLLTATWINAGFVLLSLAMIRVVGERWWGVTLLLFCPRWIYLIPSILLIGLTCLARRPRWLLTQAATATVVVVPIMGFSVPRQGWLTLERAGDQGGTRVRILSCNLHNAAYRAADLIRLIDRERIDVLCFQEVVEEPILESYLDRGWSRDPSRGIASRFPIVRALDEEIGAYHNPAMSRLVLKAPDGREFVVATVHLPSMRPGFQGLRRGDIRGLSRAVAERREAVLALVSKLDETRGMPALVAGDFNTTADSSLLDPIRDRLHFGFEEQGLGFGYTWPSRFPSIRIDHVLTTPEWTHEEIRVGPDLGSDHLPMIAEIVLPADLDSRTR